MRPEQQRQFPGSFTKWTSFQLIILGTSRQRKLIENFRIEIDALFEHWANDPEISFCEFIQNVKQVEQAFVFLKDLHFFISTQQNNNDNEEDEKF